METCTSILFYIVHPKKKVNQQKYRQKNHIHRQKKKKSAENFLIHKKTHQVKGTLVHGGRQLLFLSGNFKERTAMIIYFTALIS